MKKVLFFFLIILVLFTGCKNGYEETKISVVNNLSNVNNTYLNLKYDTKYELNTLDLYLTEEQNKPILIFVHGGSWVTGDKANHNLKAQYFTSQGYNFVSVNYPLVPEVTYEEQVQSLAKAIKYIIENNETYNFYNTNEIHVMGHSAGGHLVSLLSTDQSYLNGENLDLNVIKSTITLDAAGLDILEIKENYNRNFRSTYENVFGNDLNDLKKASPIEHIEKNEDLPNFLIIYSSQREISKDTNYNFYNKLKSDTNGEAIIESIDKSHEEINKDIGKPNDSSTARIIDFLNN